MTDDSTGADMSPLFGGDPEQRVRRAIEAIADGKMVIVMDDQDRENEGDLVMAADKVTPEAINFMARHARGLICLCLTADKVEQLELPMMVDENRCVRNTAFTVSIEARHGVTTGISAADRAHTVQVAVSAEAVSADVVSPGHIFPLKARPGGVLQRSGHTEASVDLARLAGVDPSAVICEVMKDDGTMARRPDLEAFAEQHGLEVLSIADLIHYRLRTERMVERVAVEEVSIRQGSTWKAHVYRSRVEEREFLALTLGEITKDPTLVRVHTGSVLGDVFGATGPTKVLASEAVQRIEEEGAGVILFIPRKLSLSQELRMHLGESPPVPDQTVVLREYGFGAQILSDLGLGKIRLMTRRPRRIAGIDGYGLEVVEQVLLLPPEGIAPGERPPAIH